MSTCGRSAASLAALRTASREGRLIVSESVVAEIRPAFEDGARFEEFLGDWGLEFVPSTLRYFAELVLWDPAV